MKILFAYDGSESANVAMHDLQWAGLSRGIVLIQHCHI
jgi:hypothetical protein